MSLSHEMVVIGRPDRSAETKRSQLSEVLGSADFVTLGVLSVIGLTVTLCLTLFFPLSEEVVSVLAQFG
jgi:hypothetical protein